MALRQRNLAIVAASLRTRLRHADWQLLRSLELVAEKERLLRMARGLAVQLATWSMPILSLGVGAGHAVLGADHGGAAAPRSRPNLFSLGVKRI